MKIKNVKLGDYSLKELLEELMRLGEAPSSYEKAYKAITNRINEILIELEY